MSVYAETQDMINYMQRLQNIASQDNIYDPSRLLQVVYGTWRYKLFEQMMASADDVKGLIDFTSIILESIVPFLQNRFDARFTIGYNNATYDPTVQFFHEDDMLGFLDFPSSTFFYSESKKISNLKKKLQMLDKKIRKCQKKKENIYEKYDYRNKDGIEKTLSFLTRKGNVLQASQEVQKVDYDISRLERTALKVRNELSEEVLKDRTRNDLIDLIKETLKESLLITKYESTCERSE